jgi:hypothetical protein
MVYQAIMEKMVVQIAMIGVMMALQVMRVMTAEGAEMAWILKFG